MSWAEGIRRMREIGLSSGMARADMDGIPWTADKKRGTRFAAQNTDDGAGVEGEGRTPRNRSRKGAATDRVVDGNRTSIFDCVAEGSAVSVSKALPHPGIEVSRPLCVCAEGDEVRAELSCPMETEAGFSADFAERMFILSGEPADGFVKRKDDDEGDSECEIGATRKQPCPSILCASASPESGRC